MQEWKIEEMNTPGVCESSTGWSREESMPSDVSEEGVGSPAATKLDPGVRPTLGHGPGSTADSEAVV